jgi:hypothetical protein
MREAASIQGTSWDTTQVQANEAFERVHASVAQITTTLKQSLGLPGNEQ